jgi:hypothetical protein
MHGSGFMLHFMIRHFYSHIVETESLFMEIDSLEISDSERLHLKNLAESHIHHSILDSILSSLSQEDKKEFLKRINTKRQEHIWKFLNEKFEDAEELIINSANKIKSELLGDIREEKSGKED